MKNTRFMRIALAFFILMAVVPGWATFNDDIQADSALIARWFSQEIGDALAFNASVHPTLPPDVGGFPSFGAGVSVGASVSKVDIAGFRGLPLIALDNQGGEISLPDDLPVPGAVFHVKVGLPGGFDVGVKAGGFDFDRTDSDASTEISNKVYGVEVRKRLLGGGLTGAALPDVSVSLAYDKSVGDITRREAYNGPITGGTLNAQSRWASEWNTGAATARALVGKKFFVIAPYGGVGVTKLRGYVKSDITNLGTADPGNVAVSHQALGSSHPNDTLVHGLVGFELTPLPFLRIGLSYLFAKDHAGGSLGLRVQLP